MRVVFDTNVYVSAFVVPRSLSDEAYRRARAGDVDLFTSVAILTELAAKLREKFDWSDDRIRAALKSVGRSAHVVKTVPHLSIVRDAADNRILECAEAVDADLIVTGDPHPEACSIRACRYRKRVYIPAHSRSRTLRRAQVTPFACL